MIGRYKMNERLHDITPNTECITKEKVLKKRYSKHVIFIQLVIQVKPHTTS
jgi:divalent metal cation (Fe/Co/Zn/Cd) transporter